LWSWRRDLNPRPSDYKSDALPAELRQLDSHPETTPDPRKTCGHTAPHVHGTEIKVSIPLRAEQTLRFAMAADAGKFA
jgi:hypothetical protein